MVGNAYGRKPAAMEARDTAELCVGSGALTIDSLPTHQHRQLNNKEAGPSNA